MQGGKITQVPSGMEFLELVREDLQRVDREIQQRSVASVEAITSIGHYLHSSGGKRLRPALLLLCSKLVGGSASDEAIQLAAVVEMIHAATLVHDDVIDVAETRRGRPSPNVLWGNHTSVLAGDWLYMQAFQVALEQRDFRILDILISLTQTMVEGELLQLERLGSAAVTEADYMDLVHRKTAALFSACARLGALVAGATASVEAQLSDYAWNLGMAFQLVDDVLDFTAQQDVLGKPVGSDLREGKATPGFSLEAFSDLSTTPSNCLFCDTQVSSPCVIDQHGQPVDGLTQIGGATGEINPVNTKFVQHNATRIRIT
ncbi:MAG: polyprenyl synthetase family protein [Bryobacteraceae bacterium]|nr:polyprenyl synthetase family protein [Bryobacteraceae bacterium]